MKKVFIQLYFIIAYAFLYSINSNAMIFECENGYSYKIDRKDNQSIYYFKKLDTNWQSIKNVIEVNNKLEYYLPDSTYLACSDKKLNVCRYKSLLTYNSSTQTANVREVIIADCFIGTMGCNKYEKGLELNLRRCNLINDISTSN